VPLALREAKFFTGIDWAAENHAVCVMNAAGKIAAQFTIAHTADGIALLIRRLARFGDPAGMQVAIERPNGRLVDLLLEAGHPVVPVKPNAIKAWRDGEVLSGAKSDAGDAAVIAEYLRLRQHKLTVAVPYSGQTRALRTVVRTRGDLVQTRVATANQLTALLEDCWPGAAVIFAGIASPIGLAFLARYPTPESARHLGEKRIAAFCASHHYTGRGTAAELLERLRSAPAGTTDQAITVALADAVLALAAVLTALSAAIGSSSSRSANRPAHRSAAASWSCSSPEPAAAASCWRVCASHCSATWVFRASPRPSSRANRPRTASHTSVIAAAATVCPANCARAINTSPGIPPPLCHASFTLPRHSKPQAKDQGHRHDDGPCMRFSG
jgi:hypothetical protein